MNTFVKKRLGELNMAIELIINELDVFTKEQLTSINNGIKAAQSLDELTIAIEKLLEVKELEEASKQLSLNARFPVSWMTIDQDYQQLLYDNNIYNLEQLREVSDLNTLKGMTRGGYEQISWARDFFNMSPMENIPPKEHPESTGKTYQKTNRNTQ